MSHAFHSLLQRVSRSPELQEKLEAILRQTGDARIQDLVTFSIEAGVAVSAADWTHVIDASLKDAPALSDDDLADISGGGVSGAYHRLIHHLKHLGSGIQIQGL